MIYNCICGKEFDNPQKFNGHKSHCKINLLSKGYTEKDIANRKYISIQKLQEANKHRNYDKKISLNAIKQKELNQWISEKHTCEKCGKVMTEKFGSGRFCSRSCANGHKHSDSTKQKIKQGITNYHNNHPHNKESKHIQNPPTANNTIRTKTLQLKCTCCGKIFERPVGKFRRTCSDECLHLLKVLNSINMIKKNGYHKTIYSQYKFGTYKGFECDSSWELAFLVYCLDNDLSIERNKTGFNYTYKDTERTFFPDFLIGDTYYEIKGVWTEQVVEKVNQFPKDKKLVVIDRKAMKKYIDYCKSIYGNNFAEILYDNDKPSWTQSDKYKHFIEKDYHRKSISDVCY